MSIGFILLLALNAFLFINYISDLTHLGDIIDSISRKLNATVNMVNKLNERIGDIEKGAKWTKKKLKPLKID